MNIISYQKNTAISLTDLVHLYGSVGWKEYTIDSAKLQQAVNQSLFVVSAWHGDKLVGLIRCVGDGISIVYIQDLLVLPDYRRQKIGTELMKMVDTEYSDVRQKVLLTEESPVTRKFYLSCGYHSADHGDVVAFYHFQ
ncbi:GNAT family N-acetyltransferase [Lentilactobacillus sunkii]|uniref:GNAT family acetyltransferase n=1 Tax=Lentilactobacillus sunkii DSM 19904 TaxID=1423808 RepID=A0A0R1L217_9LACO|nr:GNAT family N-acetyltransferase [Lentilactobacillus sunkii]KRK89804.1 GNAT family acetyltransferase [Lentilactobacillus sunkii DSM 19904]